MKFKKILSMALVLCMCLSFFPGVAFADDEFFTVTFDYGDRTEQVQVKKEEDPFVEGGYSGTLVAPKNPTRADKDGVRYEFVKWTYNKQDIFAEGPATITMDLTLIAQWEEYLVDGYEVFATYPDDSFQHLTGKDPIPTLTAGAVSYTVQEEQQVFSLQSGTDPVAMIGDQPYNSLAEAIVAVPANTETTITMIADSAETGVITIAEGKNVVLDLAGHTVSYTTDAKSVYFITNNGTLTVQDSGNNGTILLTAAPDTGYSVENVTVYNLGGTLNLDSGIIENRTPGGLSYAVNNSSNAWATPVTSTFNMSGGVLRGANTDNTLRVYQNTSTTQTSHNYVNISGGTIENGIFVDTFIYSPTADWTGNNIETTINISGDAEIIGLVDLKLRHPFNTSVNISDGTFTNAQFNVRKPSEWNSVVAEPTAPMVTISGGSFTFGSDSFCMAYGSGNSWTTYIKGYEITDGTFSVDPTAYLASGCTATKSGDVWTVSGPVAKIGDTGYATLPDAIAAANADTTATAENPVVVDLLTDTSVSEVISIENHITLDGHNHTITTSANRGIWTDVSEITATVKDLTIVGSKMERAVQVNESDTTLVIDGVTATATYYTVNVLSAVENLDLTVEDCVLNGWGAINLWGNTGTVTITGSTLNGVNDKGYNADGWNDFGTVVVEGDTTGQTTTHASAYEISISNTTIKASQTTGNHQWVLLYNNPSVSNAMTLTNCTIELGNNCFFLLNQSDDGAAASTTKIKGTYLKDTTDLPELPDGFVYVDVEDGYKLVSEAVAEINGTPYATLAAAFAAAQDKDTITLVDDVTDETMGSKGIVVNGSNEITLDLAGHDITCTDGTAASNRMITIKGTTILNVINSSNDVSTMDVLGNNNPVANKSTATTLPYGVFRAEVGTTLNITGTDGNLVLVNGRAWGLNVKVLGATAALDDVIINSQYGGGIEVTEADLGEQSTTGTATLTNCTFTQTGWFDWCSVCVSVSGGSELIVNSGSYTSDNYAAYVFSSGGYITVNDGTFTSTGTGSASAAFMAEIDTASYPQYTGGLVFKGGKFSGNFKITDPATAVISGGYFTADPTAYVADGYDAVASTEPGYNFMVQEHVHTYNYAPDGNQPSWNWRRINGSWAAIAIFECVKGDDTQYVRAEISEEEYQGELTTTATATFKGEEYKAYKTDILSYTVKLNGTTVNSYQWGTLCSLNSSDGKYKKWYINGELVADGRSTYTFAVTGDSLVTTEDTEEVNPVAVISSTLTTNGAKKAVFNAKWSLPTGAEVESAIIYRGQSTAAKDVLASTLTSKGTPYDTNLRVRNGDFTFNLSGLTTGKWQHVVIDITYTVNGATKHLISGTVSGNDYIVDHVQVA